MGKTPVVKLECKQCPKKTYASNEALCKHMREKHGFKKEKKDRGRDRHRHGWCGICHHVIPRGFADHMSRFHAR